MNRTLVSIISPVFNEEDVIERFFERVMKSIAPLNKTYEFEIILVNDGSTDETLSILKRLAASDSHLRVIELRRNYGQTPALQAGLDQAKGQVVITLDSDLQHFPEEIPLFLEKIEQGSDMVCGWRHQRAEGIVRRWPSRVANLFLHSMSGLKIHDFGTTYRAYRMEIVRDIRLFGEFHRYIPVMGQEVGAKITEIPIQNIVRQTGKTNYGLRRTFGVFFDLILLFFLIRYLDRPMRIFGKISIFCLTLGLLILTALFVYAYSHNVHAVEQHIGWFLSSIMLILCALQVLLAGILAELLMRIHYSQNNQRTYHVRKEWNQQTMAR